MPIVMQPGLLVLPGSGCQDLHLNGKNHTPLQTNDMAAIPKTKSHSLSSRYTISMEVLDFGSKRNENTNERKKVK